MFTFLLKYKWRKEQRKWFKHNIDLMKYLKNELNEKLVRELKLKNLIFWTHKNMLKSKRWATHLKKFERVTGISCELSWGKSKFCKKKLAQLKRWRRQKKWRKRKREEIKMMITTKTRNLSKMKTASNLILWLLHDSTSDIKEITFFSVLFKILSIVIYNY